MSEESRTPPPDPSPRPAGESGDGGELTREQKLAAIRARVAAMRAAQAGGTAPAEAQTPDPTVAAPAAPTAAPPTGAAGPAAGASGEDSSRDDKMAAIRARAEALRAARAGGTATPAAPAGPGAPAKATPARPAVAATSLEVPVSSVNPGGRPGVAPQAITLEAHGTINSSVEIRGETGENENLKKLLGGLGAYQNPLRGNAWQVDYRYYAEARRRLQAAGYTVTEKDFLDRPIATWSPTSRGWTRVQS